MRTAPDAQVVGFDFEAARTFGREPAATGVAGATPPPGHAAVAHDLARVLSIGPGSRIDVYAYGHPRTLIVDRVLPRRGVAGFTLKNEQESRNVLVAPSTFERMVDLGGGGAPPVRFIAVSNRSGVESGVGLSDTVKASIAVAAVGIDPQVTTIKQAFLDAADHTGETFTQMFTAMGSFGVFAGLLLLINLFVMLATERKSELGMARDERKQRGAQDHKEAGAGIAVEGE